MPDLCLRAKRPTKRNIKTIILPDEEIKTHQSAIGDLQRARYSELESVTTSVRKTHKNTHISEV